MASNGTLGFEGRRPSRLIGRVPPGPHIIGSELFLPLTVGSLPLPTVRQTPLRAFFVHTVAGGLAVRASFPRRTDRIRATMITDTDPAKAACIPFTKAEESWP